MKIIGEIVHQVSKALVLSVVYFGMFMDWLTRKFKR